MMKTPFSSKVLSTFLIASLAFLHCAGATLNQQAKNMKYKLEPLEYANNALEPYIDADTIALHHGKHQAAYVDKLNAAIESDASFAPDLPLELLLADLQNVPEKIRTAVRNNGGGVWNHTFYWRTLSPDKSEMSNSLKKAVDETFGSPEEMWKKIVAAGVGHFGSGWVWLGVNANGELKICATANQDSPIMGNAISPCGIIPILTLDLWEHAYYLKYQNRRQEHLEKLWDIINWKRVSERYENALKTGKTSL